MSAYLRRDAGGRFAYPAYKGGVPPGIVSAYLRRDAGWRCAYPAYKDGVSPGIVSAYLRRDAGWRFAYPAYLYSVPPGMVMVCVPVGPVSAAPPGMHTTDSADLPVA
ncbi:hypothetical protein CHU32_11510 [Superficieibacter electus]|uniref:Uncharacterized protein n=1 Tax=Superficieibacter electus TaxID=2022662 RepID=A0A2P5GQB8_9ENTR|nr:hypothetical protein [Superficieibacter electus]POP48740.1 hypothetical protein CHU32_11510 [Superficieibacter electus]